MNNQQVIELIQSSLNEAVQSHNACMDVQDIGGANIEYGKIAGISTTLFALSYLSDDFKCLFSIAQQERGNAALYTSFTHQSLIAV